MPRLANERHENYCRQRARGLAPAKAANVAGFAVGSGITTTLEENPDIKARILELMDESDAQRLAAREAAIASAKMVGAMTGVSRAWVLEQLAQVAQLASNDGEYKASIDAIKLIGEEFGMFQGGSKGSPDTENTPLHDIDAMTKIMNKAEAARELPAPTDDDKIFTPTEEQVLSMVGTRLESTKPNLAEDRQLPTGSETDVALENDFGDEDG